MRRVEDVDQARGTRWGDTVYRRQLLRRGEQNLLNAAESS